MKKIMKNAKEKLINLAIKTKVIFADQRGEAFIDSAIKILLSVVVGALLLAGIYALFGDIVLPELENRIQDMFDFAG
jgi:hypothetical protein